VTGGSRDNVTGSMSGGSLFCACATNGNEAISSAANRAFMVFPQDEELPHPSTTSERLVAWRSDRLRQSLSFPNRIRMTSHPRDVLSVEDLCKSYSGLLAVDHVSFVVGRNEILGLLGPNGAGKTTIINSVLGVLAPTSGAIHIGGIDVARRRSLALAKTNFAAVYATLPGNLTVAQNLRVFGLIYGVRALSRRIEEVLEEFDLKHLRDTKCGLLSSGEQTRAALAKALLNRPELLLLDEPTASLDPSAAQIVRARIRKLASEGNRGILWTSHNMLEVEEVCDRVLFLSHGKILLEGDPKGLPHEHGAATLEELFIRIAREPLASSVETAR
jgi:ABC-2 type transport system ATP-binding protein